MTPTHEKGTPSSDAHAQTITILATEDVTSDIHT